MQLARRHSKPLSDFSYASQKGSALADKVQRAGMVSQTDSVPVERDSSDG